ncbi:MAG: 30S ribosomal protein S2 [Patescibacteria group bacterium]
MQEIKLEELLEAGCHFGHQVTRSNPKSRDFIFEARDNIHIIDLTKTKEELEKALEFIKSLAQRNGALVVLGTKRQAQEVIDTEIKRAKQQVAEKAENKLYFVTQRWIGGTFTNFAEVVKNFKKLKDFTQKLSSDEEKSKYTKKEVGQWQKEKLKLESLYGGIADMTQVPDAIFIVDSHLEKLAVDEAGKMGVTSVAITDTNADPHLVDYPIPANDDAVGSIKLIVKAIMDAWIEGRQIGIKAEEKTAKEVADKVQKAEEKAKKEASQPVKEPKKEILVMNDTPREEPKKVETKKVAEVKNAEVKVVKTAKKK